MDILSGSYSRMEQDMAGLFQVLWGNADGTFKSAEVLNGTDDEPLIIPATEAEMLEKICTRPTAADINGDGNLDLIVGNFGGSFYLFEGEGNGAFAPKPEKIKAGEKDLLVKHHSDPFLIDWDEDGDLDMVSGSSAGGVYISINGGSVTEPKFTKMQELVAPAKRHNFNKVKLGQAHITGAQSSTRVWVDDVNGDGKFDLIVGDSTHLAFPVDGVEESEIEGKLADWEKMRADASKRMNDAAAKMEAFAASKTANDNSDGSGVGSSSDEDSAGKESSEDLMKEFQQNQDDLRKEYAEVYAKRSEIIREDHTGFVWVYLQK